MKIVFSSHAWEDYRYWCANDRKTLLRLNGLIEECRRNPFKGLGKPEPLRGELAGLWSRRINHRDRLVYRIAGKHPDQRLEIVQCKGHY
ncbi:Txe/YoeB family addiction module toxin [Pelagerythrobacter marensis]|uniref:Putative mRNA interferase YoeB n=1 Tax=Pelagerythrobacter marensis TaxID=543877 RepID=A0A0G3X6F4_9SPHN|nr:Txe/YoeB family addiction module toxin [Pelagerythrobacter marensis]AKM06767.1 Addiction module toxin [Pelagerythrobacter marensis]